MNCEEIVRFSTNDATNEIVINWLLVISEDMEPANIPHSGEMENVLFGFTLLEYPSSVTRVLPIELLVT